MKLKSDCISLSSEKNFNPFSIRMKHQTPKLNRSQSSTTLKNCKLMFLFDSRFPFSIHPILHSSTCLLFVGDFVKHRWESERKVRVMHFFISFALIWLPDDSTLIFVADKRTEDFHFLGMPEDHRFCSREFISKWINFRTVPMDT